jgi:alpha-1,3-rhamnosyl/mannosyltransferase
VRFVGHVPDEHLPGLYAGARAFVLPSLYEGFGLPALEAMGAGVPTVVSDRGGLPEVVGDAARLVDPTDRDQIATAVVSAATDDEQRTRARAVGPAWAASFTWERTAQEVHCLLATLRA